MIRKVSALALLLTPFAFGEPIKLASGPHLFLDDYLIAESHGVRRTVSPPVRDPAIANPLITGKEDGCFQPYLTVLRDTATGRSRAWYGAATADRSPTRSRLAYMESDDGIRWLRPHRLLDTPTIQFGVSVIDEGPAFADARRRFKFAWWAPSAAENASPGMKIATSPDGFTWSQLVVPSEANDVLLAHDHDINSLFHDPLRGRYVATVSTMQTDPAWAGERRVTCQSTSEDLLHWSALRRVIVPDPATEHEQTQFYAMDAFLVRGPLIIGMVKVLRDDLKADDPPDPPDAFGVGYTALAWTRDGEHWTRDREVFFNRDLRKGAWDHAHAWIDEQVPVGEDVLLYYGGYARGHKVNRFEDRQIGMVRMRRDRYVAREASDAGGTIVTPVLETPGEQMTVNANAPRGQIVVRVFGSGGNVLAESEPVSGDGVELPVRWKRRAPFAGHPVRIEFALRDAQLFAFLTSGK